MSARKSLDRFLQSATDPSRCILRVAWYMDALDAPLHDARLVVESGRVVEVTARSDPDELDLRPWIAVPPLINAHTHLEFSDCSQPLPAGDSFPDWIRQTVTTRRAEERDPRAAIESGIAESVDFGVRGLGEIATSDLSQSALRHANCDSVVFRELIGLSSSAVDSRLEEARSFLASFQPPLDATSAGDNRSRSGGSMGLDGGFEVNPEPTAACLPGLSPHAPYTVHPELLGGLVDLAVSHDVPVAMHLAETREELELLAHGTGPFRQMLEDFGVWNDDCFSGGRDVLEILKALHAVTSCLVIHGNYLSEPEQQLIASDCRFSLVVCPRTHRHFRHAPHPWRSMLESGARILVGTDGRGSNPDLDVWCDLQEMHWQYPDVAASRMLRMVTVDAREALGLEACRSAAGLTLLEVPEMTDPDASLFSKSPMVAATLRACPSRIQIDFCHQSEA